VKTVTHLQFTVATQPLVGHTLCGGMSYTPYYNDQPIQVNSPVKYNESTLTFTVQTDDVNYDQLIHSYGVNVEFTNWPSSTNTGVSTATNGAFVEYNDPCLNPSTFSVTTQTNPAPNAFTGSVTFTLNQFTIVPSQCSITYTCTSVERIGADQDPLISCADFDFDGVIDGTSTDGQLIFTPTLTDYQNGTYEPGTYVVTITGTADKATDGRSDTV